MGVRSDGFAIGKMMEMAEWRRPGTVLEDEKRYFFGEKCKNRTLASVDIGWMGWLIGWLVLGGYMGG